MRAWTVTVVVLLVAVGAASQNFNGRSNYPSPLCLLPPITGMCRARFIRFFYNSNTNSCQQFVYGGCGGNENRFTSFHTCMSTCAPFSWHNQLL
ncbi:PI-stichotoxin-Hcr2g isoform X2 [Procambarus clarkii]|uniref:PI-stichotoxin-Hcr2g isoform X2 n=1 Tax=Procambarus clarkii TaxID=6728 RepID=UPI001E671A45|nr:PI-actitoxin-Aeq3a-like [Procambarus clarkii]